MLRVVSTYLRPCSRGCHRRGACSEMAGKVLENNGTAVDATVTAMLCVGAINPESSGIGGSTSIRRVREICILLRFCPTPSGGFMVVYDPSNRSVYSFNFRKTAPATSKFDMFHSNASLSKLVLSLTASAH